jgi:hypothetical protein
VGKVGRNEPCPCGSGRKTKRCCGVQRGPSEESLAPVFLAQARLDAIAVLDVSEAKFIELMEGLEELPAVHTSVQVEVPVGSPAFERLTDAFAVIDLNTARVLFDDVLEEIDTPIERARLTRAVLALRDEAQLDELSAAAAAYELASDSRELLGEWLRETVAEVMSPILGHRTRLGEPSEPVEPDGVPADS